jgi:membrane complex biogenesis BtpA family protein
LIEGIYPPQLAWFTMKRSSVLNRLSGIFPKTRKPLIAMVHVPALPGTPLYDGGGGLDAVIRQVRSDVEILVDAGFDALLFCNENDRPYQLKAGLEGAAFMTRVVTECRPDEKPFGVDYLWDSRCALAVGAATGAAFVRSVATGAWESDMGFWQTDAAWILRERRRLEIDKMAILMNVTPEFASSAGTRSPVQIARSVVVSSIPDAILISGPMAGAAPSLELLTQVRQALPPHVPMLLNTGATTATIARYLTVADGCIVGTELKVDGATWNPVDPERAKQFIERARSAT